MSWIGLISGDGRVEWNARVCIGDKQAEQLEHGKIYTYDELNAIAGEYRVYSGFMGEQLLNGTIPEQKMTAYKGCWGLKESKKWRCDRV